MLLWQWKNAGQAGKTFVFGTDASEQIVDLLKADNDILQAVTGQDPFQIGYKTVETLVQSIEGKDVADQGKTVIVEGIPLDAAIQSSWMILCQTLNPKCS